MADFKEIIKAHLDSMAEQDAAFAERYKLESKTLDNCIKYIYEEARKLKSGNCAAVDDATVFGWAAHYYQEDDVKVKDTNAKVKVITPPAPKKEKPAPKKKEEKAKCLQLDLFSDMF